MYLAKVLFEQMDRLRRKRGELFDAAGYGAKETPYRVVHSEAGVKLRRYGGASPEGPVLLIVPAPIKRCYIWDLAPEISVVRRCLREGMRVYLAEWTQPGHAEQHYGLAEYGDRLIDACLAAIESDSKETGVVFASHSLGGLLATTFACLHPRRVRAMVLLEAPLHFGADAGKFAPLVAATPDARLLESIFGNVPGSFLDLVSVAAAPEAFVWERYIDLSLSLTDVDAFRTHPRVERWMLDEFPLPSRLFTEIIELLYREDRLMKGILEVRGTTIGPRDLKAPILNVIDRRSTVIPPESILPFHEAAASTSKKVLEYEGDIGVGIQHVGVLVGIKAHAVLWSKIFEWLADLEIIRPRNQYADFSLSTSCIGAETTR